MPLGASNMLGLVIVSLGILGIIISFLITDRKKYMIALVLSSLIIVTGFVQYMKSGVRQWKTTRKIANLQKQQRVNLQALQERLKKAQERSRAQTPGGGDK